MSIKHIMKIDGVNHIRHNEHIKRFTRCMKELPQDVEITRVASHENKIINRFFDDNLCVYCFVILQGEIQ
jgi:hypothetical protein